MFLPKEIINESITRFKDYFQKGISMNKTAINLLLLFISINLSAQTFRVGAVTGLQVSNLTGYSNSEYNDIEFNAGAKLAVDFNPQFRLGLDLLYSKTIDDLLLSEFDRGHYSLELNYVQVPLTFTYMTWLNDTKPAKYNRLHFSGGLSVAKMISNNVRDKFGDSLIDDYQYEKNRLSLLTNLGFYFNNHFGISAQYVHSLTSIFLSSDPQVVKSRIISINLIYMMDNQIR